ncbi:MAG: response regulator transcription factor [Chloroflexota bacterium]
MSDHILIVDDDMLLCRSLAFSLQNAGYKTRTIGSAEEALLLAQAHHPDVILLDIGLPGMDGLEAIRGFRSQMEIPIILLTARRRELDEIIGLEVGADDYVTKPFNTDVLIAHIKATIRRSRTKQHPSDDSVLHIGDLRIDPLGHSAYIGNRKLELTPKEFDLLMVMARGVGRVFSVDALITEVWGAQWVGESQTVYVHIRWLREKIEESPEIPRRLLTVRGAGYKLVPASAATSSSPAAAGS